METGAGTGLESWTGAAAAELDAGRRAALYSPLALGMSSVALKAKQDSWSRLSAQGSCLRVQPRPAPRKAVAKDPGHAAAAAAAALSFGLTKGLAAGAGDGAVVG